jgi:hypothetical protein
MGLLVAQAIEKSLISRKVVDDQDLDPSWWSEEGMRLSTFSIVVSRCKRR